ncbi:MULTISPECIES: hypothetical protein [unclassified Streptomyces]|nr:MULTISPECIES: hypothetical protein [unclassified Streptomyces]
MASHELQTTGRSWSGAGRTLVRMWVCQARLAALKPPGVQRPAKTGVRRL